MDTGVQAWPVPAFADGRTGLPMPIPSPGSLKHSFCTVKVAGTSDSRDCVGLAPGQPWENKAILILGGN